MFKISPMLLAAAVLALAACSNESAAERMTRQRIAEQEAVRVEAMERQEYLATLTPQEIAAEEERLAWDGISVWADPVTKCEYIYHTSYYRFGIAPRMGVIDGKYGQMGGVNE